MDKLVVLWRTRLDEAEVCLEPVALPDSSQSLDAITTNLPAGAYTTLRTYQGDRAICLHEQLQRLEQSASLAGEPVQLEQGRLREALRLAIAQARTLPPAFSPPGSRSVDVRVRLVLDLECRVGDLYLLVEPLEIPEAVAYQQGVAIITCRLERLQPEAKLTRFISRSRQVRQSLPPGVNEAVMVNAQGDLLEGLTSNFFAVVHGAIRTAQRGVLAGITRGLALESARRAGIAVEFLPVQLGELAKIEEAFITSSSRGVLPVSRIDGKATGDGRPGSVTQRLMQGYEELIQESLEAI